MDIMSTSSGIRARDSDLSDSKKGPVLKYAAVYVSWATKMEAILDGEDCWDILKGTESELGEIGWVIDPGEEAQAPGVQIAAEAARAQEIKDWKRRFKQAASLITQSLDDSLVRIPRVHNKTPLLMWARLRADYNTISPARLALATKDFQKYFIAEDEPYLLSRQNFDDLLLAVTAQGGEVFSRDQLQTLLGSLPERFDKVRDIFYAQTPSLDIEFITNAWLL